MTRFIRPAVLITVLALAGCGEPTTDVSGKVTYRGKPVAFGTVVVLDAAGAPKSGQIQPDGTYRVSGVRPGPVKVAVSSPPPPGSEPSRKSAGGRDGDDDKPPLNIPPAAPEVIKSWFPIPDKYGDPNKSELTGEAKSGQPLDIDLK
ncbi:hypothetical protein VT84_22730 [Gemmata sp. SH-PL17]|uniref:carboxypeptidase-like regulatory domain-containing protein n=1 Tax=Gemmata sp. SH-PL17 TaxID=1630693 RepID=UPI00078C20BC|nr:carboxypeptidase-like regulatory domain-containing protein [Gemmata sp. SH-PL17]AMV27235.1 hypothetical protein VT84_22730 [Gemmata sp. SH-PL17]